MCSPNTIPPASSLDSKSLLRTRFKGSTSGQSRTTIGVMRGDDRHPDSMFSCVSTEQRVPSDHPLRAILVLGRLTDSPR